jgi:hypothetical protein
LTFFQVADIAVAEAFYQAADFVSLATIPGERMRSHCPVLYPE